MSESDNSSTDSTTLVQRIHAKKMGCQAVEELRIQKWILKAELEMVVVRVVIMESSYQK